MSSPFPERKPWPMKWVAAAIVIALGGYTLATFLYRKPGRAHQPYQELKTRVNTARLLAAGFQRVELELQRPAEPATPANTALPASGGLPAELRASLVEAPLLPADILAAQAAPAASAQLPYPIVLRCSASDDRQQLSHVVLYVHGAELILVPQLERLSGGLLTRSRELAATAIVPAGVLKPGTYRATLVGEQTSRAWRLDVQ